jgi:hypothetical protein
LGVDLDVSTLDSEGIGTNVAILLGNRHNEFAIKVDVATITTSKSSPSNGGDLTAVFNS